MHALRGIGPSGSTPCSTNSIRSRGARTCELAPYIPYLNYAPSGWVLPLKFDGGGYRAGGKAMFDSEGNILRSAN